MEQYLVIIVTVSPAATTWIYQLFTIIQYSPYLVSRLDNNNKFFLYFSFYKIKITIFTASNRQWELYFWFIPAYQDVEQ